MISKIQLDALLLMYEESGIDTRVHGNTTNALLKRDLITEWNYANCSI